MHNIDTHTYIYIYIYIYIWYHVCERAQCVRFCGFTSKGHSFPLQPQLTLDRDGNKLYRKRLAFFNIQVVAMEAMAHLVQ